MIHALHGYSCFPLYPRVATESITKNFTPGIIKHNAEEFFELVLMKHLFLWKITRCMCGWPI